MRMIFFSVSDTGILGKRNSEFSQQETNLRPSDALPLSYRRLVGAKAENSNPGSTQDVCHMNLV